MTAWQGLQFQPVEQIRKVLCHHCILGYLEETFETGMLYHFLWELSEPEKVREVDEPITWGNHKSATKEVDVV